MHRKVAAFILAWLLTSSAASSNVWGQDSKPTFASTSLCGDAYLLALAPHQVKALSWQSRGPLSLANANEKTLPQAWDDAERLIELAPDIVLFGPGEGYKTQAVLEAAGIQTVRLEWAEDYDDYGHNIDLILDSAGVEMKDTPIGMSSSLFTLHSEDTPRPKILYLSRSGGSAGADTYIDVLINHVGGDNIWTASGSNKQSWFTPDAEELAVIKPDFIITSFMSDGFESAQAKTITGGVHRQLLDTTPSVDVPGAFLSCMSPQFTDAMILVDEAVVKWRAAQ